MSESPSPAVSPLDFLLSSRFEAFPESVRLQAPRLLLDAIGTGVAGSQTPMSRIIRDHVFREMSSGTSPARLLFDGRACSATGAALAAGMTIDSLDGHDGFNPVKGHIGCGLVSGLLALSQTEPGLSGPELLACVVVGYELGGRLGKALHATVSDYHTSGAWIAPAVAAACGRILGLDAGRVRHAMGIAEYHGPRSQMMRCIDHPTMVKDGSGWGAMAGVSAALLARDGFTGAPALTLESEEAAPHWEDLGDDWIILDQYIKPYPVCRWAQSPIAGIFQLKREHDIRVQDVERIRIETFHEATRLATRLPKTTEEAQYSVPYPCAIAMVRGEIQAGDIINVSGNMQNPDVLRMCKSLVMEEHPEANAAFPRTRLARVSVDMKDGTTAQTGWLRPEWDSTDPPTEAQLVAKYHDLSDPVVGSARAHKIRESVFGLSRRGSSAGDLVSALAAPGLMIL